MTIFIDLQQFIATNCPEEYKLDTPHSVTISEPKAILYKDNMSLIDLLKVDHFKRSFHSHMVRRHESRHAMLKQQLLGELLPTIRSGKSEHPLGQMAYFFSETLERVYLERLARL
jgi:hypothetical protein